MKRIFSTALFLLLLSAVCWAGGSKDGGKASGSSDWQDTGNTQTAQHQSSSSPYFSGNGGKGMSIAILAPQSKGLPDNQNYLPALVQGEFVSNFTGYSAISVLDRQRLDSQYAELLSGYYDEKAKESLDLGHLTPTDYIMGGNITRTTTGYALQMQITKSADKMTTASYSGTFTFAELDNLTGIRKASIDLLQKMGVTLTAKAQEELNKGVEENNVNAQTALARGIAAQKKGTEVAALSYYFQAAALDPSLAEALNRSSILNTDIVSGNIGDNVRNDIQWRKDWVARLTETEQYFDSFNKTESMPYTLFYSNEIKQGTIDYKTETVNLSVETNLRSSGIWAISVERALQAVYDGLNATGRKKDWGLDNWPVQRVSKLNPFVKRDTKFSIVAELVNNKNEVIGRQTLPAAGFWEFSMKDTGNRRLFVNVSDEDRKSLNFNNVNANKITDNLTIRFVSVNGTDAATAARNNILQIRAMDENEFNFNSSFKFVKCEIKSGDLGAYATVHIPDVIWGEPVISIASIKVPSNLKEITIGANINIGPPKDYNSGDLFEEINNFYEILIIYNKHGKKAGTYKIQWSKVGRREEEMRIEYTPNSSNYSTIYGTNVKRD